MVIQKTTQIMMDRLRQILAVDAVSCSQVIIVGARVGVYRYAGGAANCPNWYNVHVVGHVRRMFDRITGNVCMQILWHYLYPRSCSEKGLP